MTDLSRLFSGYDRGTVSRRQLLQALGLAAVSMPLARAFGQGQCAGRDRDTSAACNHTPFKPPFEATGWRTVLLDHFSMQATDHEREAAFYAAFLGWKVRSNDGKEIYMDIGDWGGVKIRGGYVPRPGGGRGGRGGAGRGGAAGDSTGGERKLAIDILDRRLLPLDAGRQVGESRGRAPPPSLWMQAAPPPAVCHWRCLAGVRGAGARGRNPERTQ